MGVIIQLESNCKVHDEVFLSCINNYKTITKLDTSDVVFYIKRHNDPRDSFYKYVKRNYSNVIFGEVLDFDFYINVTHSSCPEKKRIYSKNRFYITHYWKEEKHNPQLFYLTPLAKSKNLIKHDGVPFKERTCLSKVPTFTVMGTLSPARRDYNQILSILKHDFQHDYILKIIGCGSLPQELEPYLDRIQVYKNLNFVDFHLALLDTYCMLTVSSEQHNIDYYTARLTSSISYIDAYKFSCVIDDKLHDIYKDMYNLNKSFIYSDMNIIPAFERALHTFYER